MPTVNIKLPECCNVRLDPDAAIIPGLGNKQVNIFDPDGNHVEIQFAAEEEADLSPFDGAPDQPASKA